MIDQKQIESVIIPKLQEYLGCPVILANQHSPSPKYPYVSFTVANLIQTNNGTYGTETYGEFYKPVRQSWSFTVQSDNDDQCNEITLKLYDWFSLVGVTYLADNEISIERLENISNRDNLITIQYEYRRGFDVILVLMDKITHEFETIETVELDKRNISGDDLIEVIDELLGVTHE